jgi:hypothetical protein
MSDIKDDDVEKRAYSIWEAAGRPEPEIKVGKSTAKKPAKTAKTAADADEVIMATGAIKGRSKKPAASAANGSLK